MDPKNTSTLQDFSTQTDDIPPSTKDDNQTKTTDTNTTAQTLDVQDRKDVPTSPIQEPASASPPKPTADSNVTSSTTEGVSSQNEGQQNSQQSKLDAVITSPHTPKKYGGKKVIATIFVILFLLGSVAAGVFLVQRQQQIAQKATGGRECSQSPDCILLEEPGNSGSYTTPRDIDYFYITAKDAIRFDPGNLVNNCFNVSLDGKKLTWNLIGQGPSCKDVSNIQIWLKKFQDIDLEWTVEQFCERIQVRVSNKHEGFELHVEYSSDNVNWQDLQVFTKEAGEGGSYSFQYQKPLIRNWYIRARVFYKSQWILNFEERIPEYCFGDITPTTSPSPTLTPPPGQTTASCGQVKAYNTNWLELTSEQLSNLDPGDKVRFSVSGTTNQGSFDMARFTINGSQKDPVSTKKPQTEEFYYEYSIPSGVTDFDIDAEIHHTDLGWI